ncbi:hypothetical protein M8J77_017928 [Diaphorina citri]|nr:hypothetical protein M8J77_017928 [Diaphorina citri]
MDELTLRVLLGFVGGHKDKHKYGYRGQHDIKKLRRENDQLRREIWTLREEYDRLESLLKKRQLSEEEGENSEGEEEEDDEEEEEKQTEEDQDEENGQREIDKTKLHPKVEFDELSVVEEEPEELSNEDERHHRIEERIEHPEERIEHPEERHNRSEVEEPERIEPERPVTVPDIQISNVDGDGSSGVEGRRDGGCSGGQNCPGVERPIETNSNHPEIPERIPSRMNEDIHPHPTISKLRSDSLHKLNSIHPFDQDPTGPKPSQGYCPSNQRADPKPHQGCCPRADPSVAKSTEVRQPVYISPVASVRPIVSDVLVDDAKVFQTLYNRRAVLRHNIAARPQHLSKNSRARVGNSLGGVPILAAGQRDPAALPSCAAAAYCFLCILMKYFPNQAAGSRCPAACCWAALPSRSESSVVALPGS